MARNVLSSTLYCQSFSFQGFFFTFQLFPQYPGYPSAILMALFSGGQRVQVIYSIRISDIKLLDYEVAMSIMFLNKQTKPTKHMTPLCFQIYNKEPNHCAVSHLTEYLK